MKKVYVIIVLLFFGSQSCKKSLEFDLEGDQIGIEEALNKPENIQALLNSSYDIFANMMNGNTQSLQELLGDNLAEPQNSAGSLYFTVYNRGTFSFRTADGLLLGLYQTIYRTNVLMENVNRFEAELNVEQLTAEAKFLRAWCHWEIAKLWAQPYGYTSDNSHDGIALRLNSEYEVKVRSSTKDVYAQIIKDLQEAVSSLPESNEGYATQSAAKALMAKVYYMMNDFVNVEKYAGEVIESGLFSMAPDFQRFTGDVTSESIFSTVSTGGDFINNRGGVFISNYRSDNNPNPTLRASTDLGKIFNDTADQRSKWFEVVDAGQPTEFYLCHKFDKDWFSVPLLYLTEMHLLRAEAIIENNGNRQTAADDLNLVRQRAYAGKATDETASSITVDKVRLERRKEMCFEGDRTSDLKRRGAKGEGTTIRNAPWDCPGLILQYPAQEKTKGFNMNPEGNCE